MRVYSLSDLKVPQSIFSLLPLACLQSLAGKIAFVLMCKLLNILLFRTVTGTSNSFIVFPGSDSSVGLLRKTSIGLKYAGPYEVIKPVVDAFNVR